MSRRKINTNRLLMLISAMALIWVGYKLWSFSEWDTFMEFLTNKKHQISGILFLQLGLTIFNLSLETIKWQILARPIRMLSFKQSLTQIIKGIQLGMVTPARMGDPVGKSVFFAPDERPGIIVLSLAGSVLQNLVILLGALGALLATTHSPSDYLHFFSNLIPQNSQFLWIVFAATALLIIGGVLFKNSSLLKKILQTTIKQVRILRQVSQPSILKALLLTTLRYSVFSLQFLLLLNFFGLANIEHGILAVFIFFGALSFIPSAGAGDLSIRATLAIMIFGSTTIAEPGIVLASLFLWFFNLGLPAMLPSMILMAGSLHPVFQKFSLRI